MYEKGKYRNMKIFSGGVALESSEWELEKPSHIGYVKLNEDILEYNSKSFYLSQPGFIHKEIKESNYVLSVQDIE